MQSHCHERRSRGPHSFAIVRRGKGVNGALDHKLAEDVLASISLNFANFDKEPGLWQRSNPISLIADDDFRVYRARKRICMRINKVTGGIYPAVRVSPR